MKQIVLWGSIVLSFACIHAVAQESSRLTQQCAVLREIVYQSQQNNFSSLIDLPLKSSTGYQPNGVWKFSTEKFSTTIPWQGAAITEIEHATDERDSTFTENWQYVASFKPYADQVSAAGFFKSVLAQIEGCPLPVNDTILLNLKQVDPRYLPPVRPDEWAEAFLFDVPQTSGVTAATSIMFGLERSRGGLKPVLIVERMTEKRK